MESLKVGLAGIGKLGTAMMANWNKHNIRIGVYHPIKMKLDLFLEQFPNGYCLTEKEFEEIDVFILALPATNVFPFISNVKLKSHSSPLFINMATTLHTQEIKAKLPSINVEGVKFMGHWKDLLEHSNGLFITEINLPKPVEELYQAMGQVKIEKETCLTEINKLATYYAVKTAVELESEFAKRGYPSEYLERALMSITPEVIRGYCEGNLGHFAKEIASEIKQNHEK